MGNKIEGREREKEERWKEIGRREHGNIGSSSLKIDTWARLSWAGCYVQRSLYLRGMKFLSLNLYIPLPLKQDKRF
jgi:hypothetical protein